MNKGPINIEATIKSILNADEEINERELRNRIKENPNSIYEIAQSSNVEIVHDSSSDHEFNLHQHWKSDNDPMDDYGSIIKHFQD